MARRRYRRRSNSFEDVLAPIFGLASLGIVGYILTHREQIISWGLAIIGIFIVGVAVYLNFKKFKRKATLSWDDEKILYMLSGMSPTRFEQEIATMFRGLGYDAEATGGSNDGGIDVVARKDGKKSYIQCKKFMTREVTPHDVRDFWER